MVSQTEGKKRGHQYMSGLVLLKMPPYLQAMADEVCTTHKVARCHLVMNMMDYLFAQKWTPEQLRAFTEYRTPNAVAAAEKRAERYRKAQRAKLNGKPAKPKESSNARTAG